MGSKDGHAATGIADDADVVYLHGVLEATVFEAHHLHSAIHGRIMEVIKLIMFHRYAHARACYQCTSSVPLLPTTTFTIPRRAVEEDSDARRTSGAYVAWSFAFALVVACELMDWPSRMLASPFSALGDQITYHH